MAKTICPLLDKPCIERRCMFWTHLMGQNPQTGESVNKEGCTIAFLPLLMLENSKIQRETGAAMESFRNEVNAGAGSILMKALGGNGPGLPAIEKQP